MRLEKVTGIKAFLTDITPLRLVRSWAVLTVVPSCEKGQYCRTLWAQRPTLIVLHFSMFSHVSDGDHMRAGKKKQKKLRIPMIFERGTYLPRYLQTRGPGTLKTL